MAKKDKKPGGQDDQDGQGDGDGIKEDEDMSEELLKLIHFLVRVVVQVKPAVIVADSSYGLTKTLESLCQMNGWALVYVHSPGIKEPMFLPQPLITEEEKKEMEAGCVIS